MPTKEEVLVTALVLVSSSNACDDNEILNAWATATITLSGIATFTQSVWAAWRPLNEYSTGKAHTHALMATGKDWLLESKHESTKAICVALTQQGVEVSRNSLIRYLRRLREPAKSQVALRSNGRLRLYYVLTGAAFFLSWTDNVAKVISLLRAAHDSLPLQPQPSPAKSVLYGAVHRQLHEIEKRSAEIEALKVAHRFEMERMQEEFREKIARKDQQFLLQRQPTLLPYASRIIFIPHFIFVFLGQS